MPEIGLKSRNTAPLIESDHVKISFKKYRSPVSHSNSAYREWDFQNGDAFPSCLSNLCKLPIG